MVDHVEKAEHFLESKEIQSFTMIKEFFKNVFYNFLNEIDDVQVSLVEKSSEISFYVGGLSLSIIDNGEQVMIWKTNDRKSKPVASLFFSDDHCFVKYSNPLQVHYLSEDEIEDLFHEVFLQTQTIH